MYIYILTLAEVPNRYAITFSRLKTAGFNHRDFIKHNGIMGDIHPKELALKKKYWNISDDLTPAQAGCSIAHLDVYERFLATEEPYCLIVEDDVVFPKNFMNYFNEFPLKYDFLFIGWQDPPDEYSIHKIAPHQIYEQYLTHYPLCMHCYIITRSGAQKICNAIKSSQLKNILDEWFYKYAVFYDIHSICVNGNFYDIPKPTNIRLNRANGIAYQDKNIASVIDQ